MKVPAPPQFSVLLSDVLKSMGLSFSYEQFSEDTEYLYPHLDLVLDLWKGSLGLQKEHLSALGQFFRRKGLYAEDGTAISVPRRFRTYLFEIAI